ncbi:MAG: pyridoxal phosphate-dependent aminotransferase [Flavobacteriales bacterium]|nr:pyridoxal phosphate-dependent aminotransferase [Flavobacteriales bacterium]
MTKKNRIWLSPPHIEGKEKEYISSVFKSNWIAPIGPHISMFENGISKVTDNSFSVALNSGTSAIHLALILLNVKRSDVVLCPTFTFAATINPIKYLGAKPVFIDSEVNTWNMCPVLLEKAIKDLLSVGKRPKAIILVHLYGMPAMLDRIIKISNNYNIPIIEDNAEGLGSKYNKKPLGSFGKFGVLSFNGNKIITTSGGGALISKNKNLINRARKLASQSKEDKPYYEHLEVGYNYRLSNVCAAIGLGQLETLNHKVKKKREINSYYRKKLAKNTEIEFINESKGSFSNYWLTTIILKKNKLINREKLRLYLEEANIESRPLWKPMHLQPIFKKCQSYLNGVAEDLFNNGLCLPSGTSLKDSDLQRIIYKIQELYEI